VYVRPLNREGGKFRISKDGGNYPRWRRDVGELFFLDPNTTRLMAVNVTTAPAFNAGAPHALFKVPLAAPFTTTNRNAQATVPYPYVVTKDGRFLFTIDVFRPSLDTPITVALNWQHDIR
jgi:hypothetical protein